MKRITILAMSFMFALVIMVARANAEEAGSMAVSRCDRMLAAMQSGSDPALAFKKAREELEGKEGAHELLMNGIDLLGAGPGQEGYARLVLRKIPEKTRKAKKLVEPWLADVRAPVRSLAHWYAGDAERYELLATLRLVQLDGTVKGRPTADIQAELAGLSERYLEALKAMETRESECYFAASDAVKKELPHSRKEYADTLRKLGIGAGDAEKQSEDSQREYGQDLNEKGEQELMAALGQDPAEDGEETPQLVPMPSEGEPQEGYTPGVPSGIH